MREREVDSSVYGNQGYFTSNVGGFLFTHTQGRISTLPLASGSPSLSRPLSAFRHPLTQPLLLPAFWVYCIPQVGFKFCDSLLRH